MSRGVGWGRGGHWEPEDQDFLGIGAPEAGEGKTRPVDMKGPSQADARL